MQLKTKTLVIAHSNIYSMFMWARDMALRTDKKLILTH